MQTPLVIEGTGEQVADLVRRMGRSRVRLTILSLEEEDAENAGAALPPRLSKEEWERIERDFLAGAPYEPLSKAFANIPCENPEECEDLPEDLAEQHDHYIYGWDKR